MQLLNIFPDTLFYSYLPLPTFYLTGLIWTIQLNHYPSFLLISESQFKQFHARHCAIMGGTAGLPMILEAIFAIIFIVKAGNVFSFTNALLVSTIWIVTFLISVPAHHKLELTKNTDTIKWLINSNWIRTVLWTTKSVLFIFWTFSHWKL